MKKKIFFAYESGHPDNRDAILKGMQAYNTHQTSYSASSWENLKISGKILDKTILNAIDNCDIFGCDLTYLNHNVLFELGYAISRSKKLQIFLNPTINNAKKRYSDIKILKNIGYIEFHNSNDILKGLQNKLNIETIFLNQLINFSTIEQNTNDLFLIENGINSQASLDLEENIKNSNYNYLINNPSESEYQTLTWFVKNILSSKIIIVHLMSYEKCDYLKNNCELSFYAGVSLGLQKKLLLLASKPYNAPIDYTDLLIEYDDSDDCVLKTLAFINTTCGEKNENKVSERYQSPGQQEEQVLNLLKLGIGFEIAEDEEAELLNYYIEIDAYKHALKRKSTIITGRKGAGKTALFFKIKNELENDHNHYNIILKPDSEELLENVEFNELYHSEPSKKKFLFTVWRYVLLSKLLVSIYEKLNSKDINLIGITEKNIIEYYRSNEKLLALNFYGVLVNIYKENAGRKFYEDPRILEKFYEIVYQPLHILLQNYFENRKYIKIIILADNLDKTWEAKNDLTLQSEMILSLLEFSDKLPVDLKNQNIEICSLIFLRKDIFDFIITKSREEDKLTTKTIEINWLNQKNKLKELIEKRFEYSLDLEEGANFDEVWNEYFKLKKTKLLPFEVIYKMIVPRPRDIIYLISKLFESALNKNKQYIDEDDFQYAGDIYSNFLHKNLIAELKAEYPQISEIMAEIQNKYYGYFLDYDQFLEILSKYEFDEIKKKAFISTLFNNNYIIGYTKNNIINNYDQLDESYNKKFLFFFNKYKVKIVLHPDSLSIKNYYRGLKLG